jgi:hypothetical protein
VASAVLAAPVFAFAQAMFAMDETGTALAGKWAASLFTAVAAALVFVVVGRRHPHVEAFWTALVFALGTSMWSTSQALWQHPAAVLALSVALLFLSLASRDPAWAGRAGLPLALAVAARHADVALVAVLAVAVAARWPRQVPRLIAWGAPVVLLALAYQWVYFGSPLAHGFTGSASRFAEPWGRGHLGLLVSPAKGLFVFTPIAALALAGVWRAVRTGERFLPLTLLAAAAAHWLLVGFWSEWHGGRAWGPRLMTDALPLLFVFLPEGLDLAPRLGTGLAAASVAVQALGAFAYDYRWERLYQHTGADLTASLWDPVRSPIPFYAGRRVLTVALPRVREGRVTIREHPLVAFGPEGSRVRFTGESPAVTGSEATLGDVHLERAARVEDGRVRLRARWDGVFLRVTPGARLRRLELRLRGRGQGLLYVGERSFWSEGTRWTPYTVSGAFALRHRYHYPESGGPDLTVTVGTGGGDVWLESLALVPPGEPEHVLVGHRSGRPRVPASAARRRGRRSGASAGPEADDGEPDEQHGDHQALPEAGQGPGVQGTDERDPGSQEKTPEATSPRAKSPTSAAAAVARGRGGSTRRRATAKAASISPPGTKPP